VYLICFTLQIETSPEKTEIMSRTLHVCFANSTRRSFAKQQLPDINEIGHYEQPAQTNRKDEDQQPKTRLERVLKVSGRRQL